MLPSKPDLLGDPMQWINYPTTKYELKSYQNNQNSKPLTNTTLQRIISLPSFTT